MNMKFLSCILLIFCISLSVNAEVITGGVEYNTNSARDELIQTQKLAIPKSLLKANLIDNNRNNNLAVLLKGVTELKDRTLAYFSDGSYGIIYKDNPQYVWYYNNDGTLTHSEIKSLLEYPYKTYKYSADGQLVNMSLRVSKEETYIFKPDGTLVAHWIGQYCYDESGNIVMSRKILE